MASIPYFLGPDGKPVPDGGTREVLMIWPLNVERNAVEIPVYLRDALTDFGPPPNGTIWWVDHPTAATVRLADGQWHNLIAYRAIEKAENFLGAMPTPYTGTYVEEVISRGKPLAAWNF